MNKRFLKYFLLVVLLAGVSADSFAQRNRSRRGGTTRKTPAQTQATVQTPIPESAPVAAAPAPAPVSDSLPYRRVKRSLRIDESVDNSTLGTENPPLTYEHLRAEDGVYRHKIWREIDIREKMNTPFRYAVDEDGGNAKFISILMQAIDTDSNLTVFSNVDDRFTTPLTKAEVAKAIAGDTIEVPIYNELGENTGTKKMLNEINLDSFYKFRIKEEVIFDKESSRLFWRILGIAPLKNVYTSSGVFLGESELFWLYYPDFRKVFSERQAYNGKNFGARTSWEQLFESRMFYGRIVKSTMENPYDLYLKNYKTLQESGILQLQEGESIKETLFNYEQDLWSY